MEQTGTPPRLHVDRLLMHLSGSPEDLGKMARLRRLQGKMERHGYKPVSFAAFQKWRERGQVSTSMLLIFAAIAKAEGQQLDLPQFIVKDTA